MTRYKKEIRYGEEELEQLRDALEQQTLFYAQGRKVAELERAFAKKHGAKHAVATSSGTAAIHCAMIALGISPGDEVIVSPITDMGSIVPILWQGGVPVFADLDPHTYNLSPGSVEKCVTGKTRAVLAVHLAGNACDLNALKSICDARKIELIEDCAQAHGCTYNGKSIGAFGQVGCFSYNEFKHISCGDGGVCITNDDELARKLRLAGDKCYDRSPGALDRNATFLAANYRITELQAAVAIAQLGKLDSIVARRRAWCSQLHERLANVTGLHRPQITAGCEHSWWFYMLRVDGSADAFATKLKAEGVPCGAHYIGKPIYEYPLFQNHSAFDHGAHPFAARNYAMELTPIAKQILQSCVIIYVNEGYTQDDLDFTVDTIKRGVGASPRLS
jgi:dTDP-4-amino-4,6-dideoxygalactose transaminase